MPHRTVVRVRYGEVDQQGVVFNAHYLAYVDHAMDNWLRELAPRFEDAGFDVMLKKAELTWHGSATTAEELAVDASLERVGTASLVVCFEGTVGEREVFSAVVTYVCVDPVGHRPMRVPDVLRAHLGG